MRTKKLLLQSWPRYAEICVSTAQSITGAAWTSRNWTSTASVARWRRHGCGSLPGVLHRAATNRCKGAGADRQDHYQGSGHRCQALRRRYSGFAVDCTEFGGGTMTCEQCYHRDVCWHRMTIYGPYALMGINTGNMKAWCANCKPKTQIIELSMQVSQSLHDELTKYCAERVVDEL